jgi:hypothetical protein
LPWQSAGRAQLVQIHARPTSDPYDQPVMGRGAGSKSAGRRGFRRGRAGALLWSEGEPLPGGRLRVRLDDDLADRPASAGWVHVTSAQDAIALIGTGRVVALELDHDLGDDERYGKGIHVLDYLAERQMNAGEDLWPREGILLHSANSSAVAQMGRLIERYASELHRVRRVLDSGQPRFDFD